MALLAGLLYLAVLIFQILLIARLVIDWVQSFARDYRPRGIAVVAFEVVYTATDPPVRALRRLIPPVRLGPVALDLSLLILLLLSWVAMSILWRLAL